jgi:hypothetical protein
MWDGIGSLDWRKHPQRAEPREIAMTSLSVMGYQHELTSMILANTPIDTACKILGISRDDPAYAEVIERADLQAFNNLCAILTQVANGYVKELRTEIDDAKGGYTEKREQKYIPPDLKALQLLVDLRNGYSPGRQQITSDDMERLVIEFVDDLEPGVLETIAINEVLEQAEKPLSKEAFI